MSLVALCVYAGNTGDGGWRDGVAGCVFEAAGKARSSG
jgi:hypothetical protein